MATPELVEPQKVVPTPSGQSEIHPPSSSETSNPSTPPKPIHSLVLDTGPLIKGEPAISTLLAQAEELYTIPAVLAEIKDEQTRSRINTTLLPFLKLRSPKPDSIKFVTDFARRTGDLEVLSKPDIHLIALTYELEVERNGGDWRLRKTPNQQRVNGSNPKKETTEDAPAADGESAPVSESPVVESDGPGQDANAGDAPSLEARADDSAVADASAAITEDLERLDVGKTPSAQPQAPESTSEGAEPAAEDGSDDSDGEWITPSNIKKHRAKENPALAPQPIQRVLQASMLTSDYAMQNVAIRINLNVVSPALSRITHLKSWVLRCHGCFTVTRKMDKQFCPSCGQATLTRTSCSTDSSGNFKIHLKRNFQWNNRGNVFSIPKPGHGSASGKLAPTSGGGKNGWGRDLILAEDQKEYSRKVDADRRTRYKDLMDEDYLPGILTGDRIGGHGRIKVGAGRNVNARKTR